MSELEKIVAVAVTGKPKHIWFSLLGYNLQKSCAWTTLAWGLWLIMFRPLSSGSQMMRGAALMNNMFIWSPIASDFLWGFIAAIPASVQIYFINQSSHCKIVSLIHLHSAAIFIFVTILLTLAYPRTMGFTVYASLALSQLACYAQSTQQRLCNE